MSSADAVCADLRACLTFSGVFGREEDVDESLAVEPAILVALEGVQTFEKRIGEQIQRTQDDTRSAPGHKAALEILTKRIS